MPKRQPDACTLLRVAIEQLESEIYPQLVGAARYRTRVALNVLHIVERELRLGPALADEELAEVRDFLGDEGADSGQDAEAELARGITEGRHALDDPRLRALLARSLGRALAINNPRWTQQDPASATSAKDPS